jgi:hypothetical protein
VARPKLEIADIFREHGAAWRAANAGHVSLEQLKVMTAIERCRTAALGGHVERCEKCAHTVIAYNSCRNRHCPKCQASAAQEWLAEREAELLPYFHVVFTLPARIADIAYQNKAVIYDLLFKASSETMLTIAAEPEHLGARICTGLFILPKAKKYLSTRRALTSPAAPACPNPHSAPASRSPAALSRHYLLMRFRALALFGAGRRSVWRGQCCRRPKT